MLLKSFCFIFVSGSAVGYGSCCSCQIQVTRLQTQRFPSATSQALSNGIWNLSKSETVSIPFGFSPCTEILVFCSLSCCWHWIHQLYGKTPCIWGTVWNSFKENLLFSQQTWRGSALIRSQNVYEQMWLLSWDSGGCITFFHCHGLRSFCSSIW